MMATIMTYKDKHGGSSYVINCKVLVVEAIVTCGQQ